MLPVGVTNPSILRVSAALPAAGAWDAAPLEVVCAGAENVLLALTYTRGGAGGAVDFQIEVSPYSVAALAPTGAEEWIAVSALELGAFAAGVDTQNSLQRAYTTYTATGAAVEAAAFGPIVINGIIARIRVAARESGAVGTPGDCQITAVFQALSIPQV